MSVSSLPEWKKPLLERKKREEEERERRERQEEERLASIPAWKREIIQRRRAKQEGWGERDQEREGSLQSADGRDSSSDLDGSLQGSEPVVAPSPAAEVTEPRPPDRVAKPRLPPRGRVSMETITPVRQNPFIRSESTRRRRREPESAAEKGDQAAKERARSASRGRCEGEAGRRREGEDGRRGRDVETRIERYRARSEGRERDRGGQRRTAGRETVGERERERKDCPVGVRRRDDGEERDLDSGLPLVSGLRTIRADNIIIIEQESRGEGRGRRKEAQDGGEEQEKRGVTMDLRELLTGGGCVTEIRASEVVIIKPSVNAEERERDRRREEEREGDGRRDGEKERDGRRDGEKERDVWREGERERDGWREGERERDRWRDGERERDDWKDREREKDGWRDGEREKDGWRDGEREQPVREAMTWASKNRRDFLRETEWPRGQTESWRGHPTASREDGKCHWGEAALTVRGARVSELRSKFGERHRPPPRSKSSENFARPRHDDDEVDTGGGLLGDGEKRGEGRRAVMPSLFRGVPKRSFSFSDRVVICAAQENGTAEAGRRQWTVVERLHADNLHADSRLAPSGAEERNGGERGPGETESGLRLKQGGARPAGNGERAATTSKPEEGDNDNALRVRDCEPDGQTQREAVPRGERAEPGEKMVPGGGEAPGGGEEEGFTVASVVRNVEGVCFARRVAIRQNGRAAAGREEEEERRPPYDENGRGTIDREPPVGGVQAEPPVWESGSLDPRRGDGGEGVRVGVGTTAEETLTAVDGHLRHTSPFTECFGVLSAPTRRLSNPSGCNADLRPTQSILSCRTGNPVVETETAVEMTNTHGAEYDAEADRAEAEVTLCAPRTVAPPSEIHIPRTAFYGAEEENADGNRTVTQSEDGWGGGGTERRDSWRVGKPLSRVESLREKIRQKERENLRNAEAMVVVGEGNRKEEEEERGVPDRGEEEWRESAAEGERETRKEVEEDSDKRQEATTTALDVKQEVGVSQQATPRLPVPPLLSQQSDSESHSDDDADEADDRLRHEELRCGEKVWQTRRRGGGEEEGGEEEELSELEEDEEECLSSSFSDSLSPSPPLSQPPSLDAMSRIYTLKTVGATTTVGPRTTLCVGERTVAMPPHIKVKVADPQDALQRDEAEEVGLPQGGGSAERGSVEDGRGSGGLQTVRRQLELLRMREQDGARRSDGNAAPAPLPSGDKAPGQRVGGPRVGGPSGVRYDSRPLHHQHQPRESHCSKPPKKKESQTPALAPTAVLRPSRRPHSPRPQPKQPAPEAQASQPSSTRADSRSSLTPSPENSLRYQDVVADCCPPTPSCSPSSSSPAASPSASPSPTPSPTPLFSIRSASGGRGGRPGRAGQRGNTITITPKKAAGEAGAGLATAPSTTTTSTPTTNQAPPSTLIKASDGPRKRYPTAEEIVVIGGYQSLERSCLAKNRATSRGVKVCFDEARLERVCEYPSETSALASTPYPCDKSREAEKEEEEEQQEDQEEEGRGVFMTKHTRSVGAATGRVLRVDESCPR